MIDRVLLEEVESLMSSLVDASIRKSFGDSSLGGCKPYNLTDFPTRQHKHIEMYLKGNVSSLEVCLEYYEYLKDK
jgi:hypothetical protein